MIPGEARAATEAKFWTWQKIKKEIYVGENLNLNTARTVEYENSQQKTFSQKQNSKKIILGFAQKIQKRNLNA